MNKSVLLAVALTFHTAFGFGQDSLSTDGLFLAARKAAFEQKDYATAVTLSKKALSISPAYTDIYIFLGRVYNFQGQPDSARKYFSQVIEQEPGNEDAVSAYTDLEFWNDNYQTALQVCEAGLKYHPGSRELLIRKSKILLSLKRYDEAEGIARRLIRNDVKDKDARALAALIQEKTAVNKAGVQYDFVHGGKQFSDPWHLASMYYGRQTKLGTFTGRVNYANRFKTGGIQYEIDAYPRISNRFYAYASGAYSQDENIFPSWRGGFSLYANLPKSFEMDAGFRYLYFGSDTWVYTGSLGKYVKNYWINLRAYLTPVDQDVSQSYTLTGRYYFGGADDYLTLAIGSGISPDDRTNNLQLKGGTTLKSHNISAGYRHAIKNVVLSINAGLLRQEYRADTHGTRFESGMGLQFWF